MKQYNRFVKPNFDKFIYPTMAYSDIVIPRGASNMVAMDLIVRHVKAQLEARGFNVRCVLPARHRPPRARGLILIPRGMVGRAAVQEPAGAAGGEQRAPRVGGGHSADEPGPRPAHHYPQQGHGAVALLYL